MVGKYQFDLSQCASNWTLVLTTFSHMIHLKNYWPEVTSCKFIQKGYTTSTICKLYIKACFSKSHIRFCYNSSSEKYTKFVFLESQEYLGKEYYLYDTETYLGPFQTSMVKPLIITGKSSGPKHVSATQ